MGIREKLHVAGEYAINGRSSSDIVRVKKGTFDVGDWILVYGHSYEVVAEYGNEIPPFTLDKPHNILLDRNLENNFNNRIPKIVKPPLLFGRILILDNDAIESHYPVSVIYEPGNFNMGKVKVGHKNAVFNSFGTSCPTHSLYSNSPT